jgi:chromosome partitioning protein
MKILVIASQKGGVAKTTTTTEMAIAATDAGLAVAIIDTDPQATSCFWAEARGKNDIAVASVFPALLPSKLKALEEAGCDLAIIDTPAVSKDTASAAMRHADLVLIPTKPAAFDLKSMLETIEQAQSLGKPYAIMLTMCAPLHGPELNATLARMADLHHEICPVLIHQYVAYPRAQKHGLSVQELDPGGKAAAEMRQLYAYMCRRVGIEAGLLAAPAAA